MANVHQLHEGWRCLCVCERSEWSDLMSGRWCWSVAYMRCCCSRQDKCANLSVQLSVNIAWQQLEWVPAADAVDDVVLFHGTKSPTDLRLNDLSRIFNSITSFGYSVYITHQHHHITITTSLPPMMVQSIRFCAIRCCCGVKLLLVVRFCIFLFVMFHVLISQWTWSWIS